MATPVFVDTTISTILAEVVASMESAMGKTISAGQPEYAICTCIAYHKAMVLMRMNETGKSLLLSLSKAPITDYIAELLGVTRLAASYASCTLQFNLVSGHGSVVISEGTRVASSDGTVFATNEDVTIPSGTDTATVDATCSIAGTSGNGFAIGEINTILDAYAFVSSATNIDETSGGSDEETDAELIARVKLAPNAFSVAGPKGAYEYFAKSVSTSIIDVKVLANSDNGDIPAGEVWVYVLSTGGTQPSQSVLDSVSDALSADDVRPVTDTVKVKMPALINYSVVVNVTQKKSAGTTLQSLVTTAVNAYLSARSLGLGLDVVKSRITAACMGVDGVYSANVTLSATGGNEIDALTITGSPTSAGNIKIGLNNVESVVAVGVGDKEKDTIGITGAPSADGNVKITLNGVDKEVAVISDKAEKDAITITNGPTADGNVKITLNGVDKEVAVYAGTYKVVKLTITSSSEVGGNVVITFNGQPYNVLVGGAADPEDIAIAIRSTNIDGWTLSGTGADVYFTRNIKGSSSTIIYSDGGTGADGLVTTITEGVATDTPASIATRIAGTSFSGWSTSLNNATVSFTKSTTGVVSAPAFSGNATGVTGNAYRVITGSVGDTAIAVATKLAAQTYDGWSVSRVDAVLTFTKSAAGVVTATSFSAQGTGVTASISVVTLGSLSDTPAAIASRINALTFDGWTTSLNNATVTFTKTADGPVIAPTFDAEATGVTGNIQRIQQGYGLIVDDNLVLDASQVAHLSSLTVNITGTTDEQ